MTPEEYIELGLVYIKERNWKAALSALLESKKRFSDGPPESLPPVLLSTLGLCLAMAENNIQEALNYCRRAVVMQPYRPEFYYYLGLIYLKAGKKTKALSVFYKGLKLDPEHPGILGQLHRMGVRKRPIFPFLPREHLLNKYLGIWFIETKR